MGNPPETLALLFLNALNYNKTKSINLISSNNTQIKELLKSIGKQTIFWK